MTQRHTANGRAKDSLQRLSGKRQQGVKTAGISYGAMNLISKRQMRSVHTADLCLQAGLKTAKALTVPMIWLEMSRNGWRTGISLIQAMILKIRTMANNSRLQGEGDGVVWGITDCRAI